MAIKPTDCVISLRTHQVWENGEAKSVYDPFWQKFLNSIEKAARKEFDELTLKFRRENPLTPIWRIPVSYYDIFQQKHLEETERYKVKFFTNKKGREFLKFETHADLTYFMIIWG